MRGLTDDEYVYLRAWVAADEGDAFYLDSTALAVQSCVEMGLVSRTHEGDGVFVVDMTNVGRKALRVEELCRSAGSS